MIKELFKCDKPVIGVVHLEPLPGSPLHRLRMDEIVKLALDDARALYSGGVDGIIIENYGDVPYYPGRVPPVTTAAMAVIVEHVVRAVDIPVGVNVLRNDWESSLSIAHVTGASFIRVNILSGSYITDQGYIEGEAHLLHRLKASLNSRVKVFADVDVKHAGRIVPRPLEDEARDLSDRSLADAIIVTGEATGRPPRVEKVKIVKKAVGEKPVIVGSGMNPENIGSYLQVCDGFIVGTYFKSGRRVNVEKVRTIVLRVKHSS